MHYDRLLQIASLRLSFHRELAQFQEWRRSCWGYTPTAVTRHALQRVACVGQKTVPRGMQ